MVSVGQLAAKLQAVKFGGWSHQPGVDPGPPRLMLHSRIFFKPPTLFVALQPVDLQKLKVPFWKDLTPLNIHIVNSEAQQDF